MSIFLRFLPLLAMIWAAGPLRASQPAAACERAAIAVAAESGVPADILGALTLTETGRRAGGIVRPWAWSVNAEGKGAWFDDPGPALAFAEGRVAQGRRNLDIGCFQLNYRWHGANFDSVSDMFDPVQNARYAAHFLRQLYAETGDWRAAAGAFHSRRPGDASRYLARFDQLRAGLQKRGWAGLSGAPETYNSFAAAPATDEALVAPPGGLVQGVLRRIAGAGHGARAGDGVPYRGEVSPEARLDAGQAPADAVGGALPEGALGLGVEAPVPEISQGGGLDIALDAGGGAETYIPADDPDTYAAVQPGRGAPLDAPSGEMPITEAAAAPGQWLPQRLPGEDLTLQQLAMDLTGQSGGQPVTIRRHRESQAGTTLLGGISGSGEPGGAGSLALLADARPPLLRSGTPLLARAQP